MSETIRVTMAVQLSSGLNRAASKAMEVEAYDVIAVTIADKAKNSEVELGGGERVQLLWITADDYGTDAGCLTYKLKATGDSVALDAPQLLVGGAVKLLGAAPPKSVFFTNEGLGKSVGVQILVGRDATPPPP